MHELDMNRLLKSKIKARIWRLFRLGILFSLTFLLCLRAKHATFSSQAQIGIASPAKFRPHVAATLPPEPISPD